MTYEDKRAAIMALVQQAKTALAGAEALAEKMGQNEEYQGADAYIAEHCRSALSDIHRIEIGSA